jgi:predicted ABC-type ATPase
MKTSYLVVGAIGSGKSAISDFILSDQAFQHVEYVASDGYKSKYFAQAKTGDNRGYRCADGLVFFRIEQLCKAGADFAYEFAPTNANKIATVKHLLHKYGYAAVVLFVGTESRDINLARCRLREARGLDAVPGEKVKNRYDQALSRAVEMMLLARKTYFIDNSQQVPKIVATVAGNELVVFDPACTWFRKHVQQKLISTGETQ